MTDIMMIDGEDLGVSALIHLDVESLNPAIIKREKSEISTTRKCYSYIKKKVGLIAMLYTHRPL